MRTYNLTALSQKSFYGKAKVIEHDNGAIELKSYETIVCRIEADKTFTRLWGGYSSTTMKHINDFRRTFDMCGLNKKEWCSLPCENSRQFKVEYSNGFVTHTLQTIFGSYEEADKTATDYCHRGLVAWVYEV